MRSKLINVRLSPQDASKAEALKSEGVELSSIVREAIRSEYALRLGNRRARPVKKILEDICSRYPVPEKDLKLPIDMTNRREMQEYISQKLRIKQARIHAQSHALRKP